MPDKNDLAAAVREFKKALEEKEAPEYYLKLCIQAVEREMSPPEPPPAQSEPPPAQSATASLVVKGAQEGEILSVLARTGVAIVENQPVGKYFGLGRWSGDAHLWWHGGGKPGDLLKLQFSSNQAGTHAIVLAMTRAPDYGIFKVSVNGNVVAEALDLFQPEGVGVAAMTFENVELKAGENELLFEIVGTNPKAHAWKDLGLYMMGLDYVLVK